MTEDRFSLYRLCPCAACEGRGKAARTTAVDGEGYTVARPERCPECRGEGRVRQEVATCATEEAVGVAIVTLGREGEFAECPFGLLDRTPPCERCEGVGVEYPRYAGKPWCPDCKGSGVKATGTWLINPWLPSARNVRDAARTLARSKARPS